MYLLNRKQRHYFNNTWMLVSVMILALLPFLLFAGLYGKSFFILRYYPSST